ncbi:hypothetical protein K438DRAFT_1781181 [Mycena galopus ATCC 62051]|nr:hypothetical protein K438DRAFT_1781181 [Mycena galopus ATCC 62051]
MVSSIPGSLSKVNEDIVRKVFKAIKATKYEDPVDQDSFLIDSANSMRAHIDRIQAAEGAASRIERNTALEYTAQSPHSPGNDAVSIPSGDKSDSNQPLANPKILPPSLIADNLTNILPSSEAALSVVTKPLPTGPRAGLQPRQAPASRKRRRVEEDDEDSQPAQTPYAHPGRPVEHSVAGSTPAQSSASPSEAQLRGQLAALQAEIHRLCSTQKEIFWQLQTLGQSEPSKQAVLPQES